MSDPTGTAAEEAARLLAAAEQWARTRAGRLLDEHLATGSAACTSCPVCSGITALRAVRPETVEHLLDAAASLVAAVRSAVHPPEGAPTARPGGVERIDVTEGEWD